MNLDQIVGAVTVAVSVATLIVSTIHHLIKENA